MDDPPRLRALSIRQPWAQEVIRGDKTIDYRDRPTHVRGRIYIYASLDRFSAEEEAELALEVGYDIADLPRGVLIGTVELVNCIESRDVYSYEWHFARPERLRPPLRPEMKPRPVWFNPFGNDETRRRK